MQSDKQTSKDGWQYKRVLQVYQNNLSKDTKSKCNRLKKKPFAYMLINNL